MENYYWQLPDGRVWSFSDGGFVAAETASETIQPVADMIDLRARVIFYGGELGELATKLDRINSVQERYRPDLTELDAAWLSAQIDGDQETMTEIAAEKQTLRAAMAAEIKAIQQEAK